MSYKLIYIMFKSKFEEYCTVRGYPDFVSQRYQGTFR